ncbi:ArnT family glycosyltransferase [Pseudonocardia broussonetiae]|uniref:Phospholipid carrier-dependent glycosyltransferase n=1 Tax=Pseudonocardia broussonetiae TaxID=2736640 RepID=A0A6M6JMU9_9PSEU|nr:phospholipid carrier-dependent glycosyltransferase [Pseudonocardia broussonetiae]QJY48655.1 phospholipid carrier-dependent glycosyltransferase [Pseudonocardia broussonetiae]
MSVTIRTEQTPPATTAGDRPPTRREIGRREVGLWTLGSAALSTAVTLALPHLGIGNDSYQYLGVADNLLTGAGVTTDIPFFDVETAHGVVPSPITTHPPGYPVAIAAARLLGLPPVAAAVAVSVLAAALTVLVLGLACRRLGVPRWAARVAVAGFMLNPFTLVHAGSVLSESLFTLLVTSAVLGMVVAERTGARTASVLAGVALGLSVHVRYAGLFVVVGAAVGLTLLLLLARRDRRSALALALTVGTALPLFAPLLVRNQLVAGTWRGGNDVDVDHPVLELLAKTAWTGVHLVVGDASGPLARVPQALLAVAVLAALVLLVRRRPDLRDGALVLLAAAVVVYAALMFEAGLVSVISYGPRMFLPVLPAALLLLALAASRVRDARPVASRAAVRAGAAVVAVAALAVGVLGAFAKADAPPHVGVAERLAAPLAGGGTTAEWLDAHLAPGEPVVAADGQATGYALQEPVVGLVESTFSDTRWDEETVAALMDRSGARYLLLYRHPQDGGGALVEQESPFLGILLAGRPAETLRPVASSAEVLVLERR